MSALGGKQTFDLYGVGEVEVARLRVWCLTAIALTALTACDGYTYKGRTGEESRAMADAMPLPKAYSFYVETYKGTSPPMLDVAETLHRFGPQGTSYVVEKALQTNDAEEFGAASQALVILDYRCPIDVAEALRAKSVELGEEFSACPSKV